MAALADDNGSASEALTDVPTFWGLKRPRQDEFPPCLTPTTNPRAPATQGSADEYATVPAPKRVRAHEHEDEYYKAGKYERMMRPEKDSMIPCDHADDCNLAQLMKSAEKVKKDMLLHVKNLVADSDEWIDLKLHCGTLEDVITNLNVAKDFGTLKNGLKLTKALANQFIFVAQSDVTAAYEACISIAAKLRARKSLNKK